MSSPRKARCTFCITLAALLAAFAASARACTICIGFPKKSAADFLIESSCVALAREDPGQPFSFAPVEILKGNLDGTKIGLFLDSVTKRILAGDARRTVVLIQPSKGRPWRSLGLASTEYEAIVRRIVLLAPVWQGADGKNRRVEFFLSLFGHEDPLINELAYLEMGRASYAAIKRLSRVVSREQIEPMLRRRQYIQWRSLAILMLAHRGEALDRKYIVESFHTSERFGLTTNLAAWAAASIELNSADAVSFIEDKYFRNPDRRKEELIEVLKAMSLHGTQGRIELREQIVASYAMLLDMHPQMAAQVAADLLTWKRTELTAELARVEAANATLDYAGKNTVRRYLRMAANSTANGQIDDSPR